MTRIEGLAIIASVATGIWCAANGILAEYLFAILFILVFCAICCSLGCLIVWLDERRERQAAAQRQKAKTCSHCGRPLGSYGLCPDL